MFVVLLLRKFRLAHEYYHVMQLQNGLDSGPLGIYDDARNYTAYRFQWFLALQSGASQSEIDLIVEKLKAVAKPGQDIAPADDCTIK